MNGNTWERQRLEALDRYRILDTPPEQTFDEIVKLVCGNLNVPIAAVNLIAEHRQWFKSEVGLGVREMELDDSICARAILQSDFFVVPDTTKDARFEHNALVTGGPGLRFYAGALLKTEDGFPIGTLCALDTKPRPEGLTPDQTLLMKTLARMIMNMLDLRLLAERQQEALETELSERLRIEEALRQSQKIEAIGLLTGGVAHDFNNLLTVIRGSVDLLRRPDLTDEKRQRYFDAIADTADRAAALTRQLLAYARRQPLKPEVFDAADQIRGVDEMLRSVVGSRVQIRAELNGAPCPVEADPNQFETALLNLVVNGRDAMADGGEITIRIGHRDKLPAIRAHPAVLGDYVAVEIEDSGSGIAPDQLEDIFTPFYTTKEVGKGTGLGLSQVFGFAKQSGGDVAVESTVGKGTTFTLYLPRATATALPVDLKQGQQKRGQRGCVLLVEDNGAVGDFAADSLEVLGYQSVFATSADEALGLLEAGPNRFDVVFSDVVMPGMSGIDLGRIIRTRWPAINVVLTSGYSHILATEGRDGFRLIQKPYTIDQLDEALRATPTLSPVS